MPRRIVLESVQWGGEHPGIRSLMCIISIAPTLKFRRPYFFLYTQTPTDIMASPVVRIALWDQVVKHILNPDENKPPAHVVCPICLEAQLDILGLDSPQVDKLHAEAGVALFCGHMLCAPCWESHRKRFELLSEDEDEDEDKCEDECIDCPVCGMLLEMSVCECQCKAAPLPGNNDTPILCNIEDILRDAVPPTVPEAGIENVRPDICSPCRQHGLARLVPYLDALINNPQNPPHIAAQLFDPVRGWAVNQDHFHEVLHALKAALVDSPKSPWNECASYRAGEHVGHTISLDVPRFVDGGDRFIIEVTRRGVVCVEPVIAVR